MAAFPLKLQARVVAMLRISKASAKAPEMLVGADLCLSLAQQADVPAQEKGQEATKGLPKKKAAYEAHILSLECDRTIHVFDNQFDDNSGRRWYPQSSTLPEVQNTMATTSTRMQLCLAALPSL